MCYLKVGTLGEVLIEYSRCVLSGSRSILIAIRARGSLIIESCSDVSH